MQELEKLIQMAKANGGTVHVEGDKISIDFETTTPERKVPKSDTPASEIHKKFDEEHAGEETKGYLPPKGDITQIEVHDRDGSLTLEEAYEKYNIHPSDGKQIKGEEFNVADLPSRIKDVITEVFGYGLDEVKVVSNGVEAQVLDLNGNNIDRPRAEMEKLYGSYNKQEEPELFTTNTDPEVVKQAEKEELQAYKELMQETFDGIYRELDKWEEEVFYPDSVEELVSLEVVDSVVAYRLDDSNVDGEAFGTKFQNDLLEEILTEFSGYPFVTANTLDVVRDLFEIAFTDISEADDLKDMLKDMGESLGMAPWESMGLVKDTIGAFKAIGDINESVAMAPFYDRNLFTCQYEQYLQGTMEVEEGHNAPKSLNDIAKSKFFHIVGECAEAIKRIVGACCPPEEATQLIDELNTYENTFVVGLCRMGMVHLDNVMQVKLNKQFLPVWDEVAKEVLDSMQGVEDEADELSNPESVGKFRNEHVKELADIEDQLAGFKWRLSALTMPDSKGSYGALFDNHNIEYEVMAFENIDELTEVVDTFHEECPIRNENELTKAKLAVKKLDFYLSQLDTLRELAIMYTIAQEDLGILKERGRVVVDLVHQTMESLNGKSTSNPMTQFYVEAIERIVEKIEVVKFSKELGELEGLLSMLGLDELGETPSELANLDKESTSIVILYFTEQILGACQYILAEEGKEPLDVPTVDKFMKEVQATSVESQKELEEALAENDKKLKEDARKTGEALGRQFRDKAIVAEYEQGVPIAEIMKAHGINSNGTLYSILRAHGVAGDSNSKVAQRVAHVENDAVALRHLINDYKAGDLSLAKIYKKYGVHKNGLYYLLDKYNVPRRTAK